MDASTAKTLGIIGVILLVLLVAWPIKYLLFAPVGVVHGIFNGFHFRNIDRADSWAWPFVGFAGFLALAALIVWVAIMVWVYKDAEKRGMSGVVWGLVVFFVHFIGLLIYFLVRANHPATVKSAGPEPPSQPCPKCGKSVDQNHAFCPACGEQLRRTCPKCGKEIQPGWKSCPYCAQKL